MLERKKIKSRNHGVSESRSFLLRYIRTYVLKIYQNIFLNEYAWKNLVKIPFLGDVKKLTSLQNIPVVKFSKWKNPDVF